jgi:sec-independent protein translocase protein TatA
MNFGNMGFMEILLILVVVLLLFGAKRLPEIGASMGKGIREFKKSISDVDRNLREPASESRIDRDYSGERIQNPARETAQEEQRPEPKRLLS